MFGIYFNGPANVLCDNQSCVNNSSKVNSILNKKHYSLMYHYVRHAVAARIVRIGKVNTKDNLADAFTN